MLLAKFDSALNRSAIPMIAAGMYAIAFRNPGFSLAFCLQVTVLKKDVPITFDRH